MSITIAQLKLKALKDIATLQEQLDFYESIEPTAHAKKHGPVRKPRKPRKRIMKAYKKGISAKQLADEFTGGSVRDAMKKVITFTNFGNKQFGMAEVAQMIVNPKIRKPRQIRGAISVGLGEMPNLVTRVKEGKYVLKQGFNTRPTA